VSRPGRFKTSPPQQRPNFKDAKFLLCGPRVRRVSQDVPANAAVPRGTSAHVNKDVPCNVATNTRELRFLEFKCPGAYDGRIGKDKG